MSILKKICTGLSAVAVTAGVSALIGAAGGGIIHATFGDALLVNFYAITGLAGLYLSKRGFDTLLDKSERVGFAVGGVLTAALALGGGLRSELKKGVATEFRTATKPVVAPAADAPAKKFELKLNK